MHGATEIQQPSLFSLEILEQGYIDDDATPAPIVVEGPPPPPVSMDNMGDRRGYIHQQRDPIYSFTEMPWFLANQADSSSSSSSFDLGGALWPSVKPMNFGYEDDAMTDEDHAEFNYWLQQLLS